MINVTVSILKREIVAFFFFFFGLLVMRMQMMMYLKSKCFTDQWLLQLMQYKSRQVILTLRLECVSVTRFGITYRCANDSQGPAKSKEEGRHISVGGLSEDRSTRMYECDLAKAKDHRRAAGLSFM